MKQSSVGCNLWWQKNGCGCEQTAHAHFSFCPCVQVFSRNAKLLINRGVGIYSRLYQLQCVQYRIQFPSLWCQDYEFSLFLSSLLVTPPGPSFFFLFFCHSVFLPSPPPLHSPAQRQIKYIFIHRFPLFRLCAAARKCFAKQQMDCVRACVCVRLQYVCVWGRSELCVYVISPPAALKITVPSVSCAW